MEAVRAAAVAAVLSWLVDVAVVVAGAVAVLADPKSPPVDPPAVVVFVEAPKPSPPVAGAPDVVVAVLAPNRPAVAGAEVVAADVAGTLDAGCCPNKDDVAVAGAAGAEAGGAEPNRPPVATEVVAGAGAGGAAPNKDLVAGAADPAGGVAVLPLANSPDDVGAEDLAAPNRTPDRAGVACVLAPVEAAAGWPPKSEEGAPVACAGLLPNRLGVPEAAVVAVCAGADDGLGAKD